VSRIVDLASANQLMSYVQKTQQRLNTLQTQLSSGKTSQDYTGIARDSGRLIRLENARDLYQRFMTTNQTMDLRLKTVETTLGAVQTTVKDFRAAVLEYDKGATGDPERVAAVQDAAFKSLVSLQGLLNTESDGRYLLAGSKATTRPVDFGLTRLKDFQDAFDGATVTVPTTREIDSYYRGDTLAQTHRVDAERSVSLDLTAADPAFEKAIRAMKLIAQGQFGSEGGLDQNTDRIGQALALLDSALDRASPDAGRDGPEAAGNLETIQMEVGLHRALINDTNERLRTLIGALDGQVADVETINPTEVATRLFDQANALEASLTTIARVRQLSLMKFL
jgi:flagellin-like hook-associated protein FlgL